MTSEDVTPKFSLISVMPTNLYGPNDNYDPMNSHVLPALIRRFHEAKVQELPFVEVWGTGSPRREFLYSDDLGEACVFLMKNYNSSEIINIGTGEDITIKNLTNLVVEVIGYQGKIQWDTTKPDGTPQKLLDVSRLNNSGWKHKISLETGLKLTYNDFLKKFK